jgi:hypothetical protein
MAIRKVHKRIAAHFAGLVVVMVVTGLAIYSYDRGLASPATQSSAESGSLVESASTNPTASPTPTGSPTIDTSGTGGVVTVGGAAPTNVTSGDTPKQSGLTSLTANPVFLIICALFGFGVVWVFAVSRDWLTELSAGHGKMRLMRIVAAISLLAFFLCLTWLFIQAYIFTR